MSLIVVRLLFAMRRTVLIQLIAARSSAVRLTVVRTASSGMCLSRGLMDKFTIDYIIALEHYYVIMQQRGYVNLSIAFGTKRVILIGEDPDGSYCRI